MHIASIARYIYATIFPKVEWRSEIIGSLPPSSRLTPTGVQNQSHEMRAMKASQLSANGWTPVRTSGSGVGAGGAPAWLWSIGCQKSNVEWKLTRMKNTQESRNFSKR